MFSWVCRLLFYIIPVYLWSSLTCPISADSPDSDLLSSKLHPTFYQEAERVETASRPFHSAPQLLSRSVHVCKQLKHTKSTVRILFCSLLQMFSLSLKWRKSCFTIFYHKTFNELPGNEEGKSVGLFYAAEALVSTGEKNCPVRALQVNHQLRCLQVVLRLFCCVTIIFRQCHRLLH